MTTFKKVGAGPGLQGREVGSVRHLLLDRIFKVIGRATVTGPGGSMKYELGYSNGNTETNPFPVNLFSVNTGCHTTQALASSCVLLAPAKPGQIPQQRRNRRRHVGATPMPAIADQCFRNSMLHKRGSQATPT